MSFNASSEVQEDGRTEVKLYGLNDCQELQHDRT